MVEKLKNWYSAQTANMLNANELRTIESVPSVVRTLNPFVGYLYVQLTNFSAAAPVLLGLDSIRTLKEVPLLPYAITPWLKDEGNWTTSVTVEHRPAKCPNCNSELQKVNLRANPLPLVQWSECYDCSLRVTQAEANASWSIELWNHF